MAATINVNNRTVVHKSSNGVSTAFPDVCKTPSPGGPVPIPYPNIAMSSDTSKGSKSVKMDGNPIMLKGSVFSTSTGDEAGTAGGGVVSSKTKGKAEFVNYSFDVQVEGKNVPRLGDMMVQNKGSPGNTPPIPEIQPPIPPAIAPYLQPQDFNTEPCDAAKLTITETGGNQKVFCDTKARKDSSLTAKHLGILGDADLLLECIADFDNNYGISPSKKVTFAIDTEMNPQASVHGSHPALYWDPFKNADFDDKYEVVYDTSLEKKDRLAPSIRNESGHSQGWLGKYWNFNDNEKAYRVAIYGCGIVDSGEANRSLSGLIKIYPNQTWKVTLSIPAFATIKKTRDGSIDLRGNQVSNSSSSTTSNFGRSGDSSSSSHSVNRGQGNNTTSSTVSSTQGGATESATHTQGMQGFGSFLSESESYTAGSPYIAGRRESYTASDSTNDGESFLGTNNLHFGPQFSLTINGQSLDVSKRINNILTIAKTIRDTWNTLQKWAPKVGWSASLDIAIFEGSFSGEWGYRSAPKAENDRIWLVQRYIAVEAELKLFYCKASISFGIEMKVENWLTGRPFVEVILKIEGAITVSVPLSMRYETKAGIESLDEGDFKSKIAVDSLASLAVIGRASLLDITYEASVSIDGGFAIEGEFICGFNCDPKFSGKIFTKPVVVHITLIAAGEDPYRKDIECLPKKDVWQGVFPKPT